MYLFDSLSLSLYVYVHTCIFTIYTSTSAPLRSSSKHLDYPPKDPVLTKIPWPAAEGAADRASEVRVCLASTAVVSGGDNGRGRIS